MQIFLKLKRRNYDQDQNVGKIHWLRDHFGSFGLHNLNMVLAEVIFPEKIWKFVDRDEYLVVMDIDRSLVFDIMYCDQLSAMGSLALCGDPEAMQNSQALEEVLRFRNGNVEKLEFSLAKMKDDIARFSSEGEVVSITKSRDRSQP